MRIDKFPNNWQDVSGANRPIRLFIATSDGGATDRFLVHHLSGVETVCGAMEYTVLCVAQIAGLEVKQFIACPVQLQLVTANGQLHAISGIVSEVHEGCSSFLEFWDRTSVSVMRGRHS